MSRASFPASLGHHTMRVLSPPSAEYDADIADLLNGSDGDAVKYLTHDHTLHPRASLGENGDAGVAYETLTWSVDDVAVRRQQQVAEHDAGKAWFCVVLRDGVFAGVCSIRGIDWQNKSAEMGMILRPELRGTSVSSEAHFVVLSHAFDELQLNRITFTVLPRQEYTKHFVNDILGATLEGTLRDYYFTGVSGWYQSVELYSILASEWAASFKTELHRHIAASSHHPIADSMP